MKLPEMVLKLQSGYMYMTKNTINNVQKAITPKVCQPDLWFLFSACCLMVGNFMKLSETGFQLQSRDTSICLKSLLTMFKG